MSRVPNSSATSLSSDVTCADSVDLEGSSTHAQGL
jgi:hypothetical protein